MAYTDQCMEITIPCFVSNTVPADKHLTPTYQYVRQPTLSLVAETSSLSLYFSTSLPLPSLLPHRTEYTLYLEVTAPAVRPKLILAHSHSPTIDFRSVGTGDVGVQTVTVLNISTDTLKLSSSLLDPSGPFQLRNALRYLPPQKTHDLLLHFAPTTGGKVCSYKPSYCSERYFPSSRPMIPWCCVRREGAPPCWNWAWWGWGCTHRWTSPWAVARNSTWTWDMPWPRTLSARPSHSTTPPLSRCGTSSPWKHSCQRNMSQRASVSGNI